MLKFDELYSWVRDLPIIDWHNHLDLGMIAADKPFGSLYEVWVKADPYKHRAMRICGESEDVITGFPGQRTSPSVVSVENCQSSGQRTSPSVDSEADKWSAWMRTLPKLVGNPIFAWAKMELEFLGLDPEPYLHGRGENVSLGEWTPSMLLKKFNCETICPCLGAEQISSLDLNGRGRPFSRGACVADRDNGRPRPLHWTAPSLRLFSSVGSDHISHFSNSLESDDAHRRNLPHVSHDSALVFITFRLADSLPAAQLQSFADERAQWLQEHPKPWDEVTAAAYFAEVGDHVDHWLDAGHGSCLLADERCRRIVEESLEYFNGERTAAATDVPVRCAAAREPRYILHGYVVMPNHVHVLVELIRGSDMTKIVQGWKSFSARKINETLGTTGPVWREEYYDRLIRDEGHYQDVLAYLKKNETAARAIAHTRNTPLRATDGDVRCPETVPSLRINAGERISNETLERFEAAGCRVVDISVDDAVKLETEFDTLAAVAAFAAAHNWTMLLHLGALRETSSRLRAVAGPAGGFAGMRAPVDPAAVARFLNRLESGAATDGDVRCPGGGMTEARDNGRPRPLQGIACPSARDNGRPRPLPSLPRTILLSLNPEAHAQLAVLAGSFNGAGVPGKVQLGPAWWWCDHEEGIRDVLEKNAAYGVLSTFIGMTTDSRSLLSFVRHDYFRRILCKWTAEKIAAGRFPSDESAVRPILENICYNNAKGIIS